MKTTFNKPVLDLTATGKQIRALRTRSGISVRTMQALFSFPSPQSIYNWEAGKNMPTIDNLIVLSQIFGEPVENIVCTRKVQIEIEEVGKTRKRISA